MSVSTILSNGKIIPSLLPVQGHPVSPPNSNPATPRSPTIHVDSTKWVYNLFHDSGLNSVTGLNNSYRKVFKNYSVEFCRFNNRNASATTNPNGAQVYPIDVSSSDNGGAGDLGGAFEYPIYELNKSEIRNISTASGQKKLMIRFKGTNHCSFSVPDTNSVPNIGWTDTSLTGVDKMHSVMITPQIEFYIDGSTSPNATIIGSSYVETFSIETSSHPQDFISNWDSYALAGDVAFNNINVFNPTLFKSATSCQIKVSLWAGGFQSENNNNATVQHYLTLNSERGYEAYDKGAFEAMSNQANSTLNTCDVFFSILPYTPT